MGDNETFVWQGEELPTIGDLTRAMDRIWAVPDVEARQKLADEFMAAYRENSEYADVNIGYLTGYRGTMVAMLRLFGVSHPVFGGPALADKVTPEGAFAAGQAIGTARKESSQS